MSKLHIAVVTGTRAEFGIWHPVLDAIGKSHLLKSSLLVTGMHLLPAFGNTQRDITKQGHKIAARIPMYKSDEPSAKSLARAIDGFAKTFRRLKPGLVFLLGDRLEMLAAANAALAERIPIAHLHGGESARGIWDEQIRHAISKMAHIHFCATAAAAARIRQMGEAPASIHQVGAPALDMAVAAERAWRPMISKRVAGTNPLLLLHPSSPDEGLEYRRTRMLIGLLQKADHHPVIHAIGPNNDPGHRGILRAYREQAEDIQLAMSVPQDRFWMNLITSGLLIGNSSAGIIEAASFGIPVINIGDRQSGRDRNPNVIDVGWKPKEITAAIEKASADRAFLRRVARRVNVYSTGHACGQIVKVLELLARSQIPLEKQFWD